MGKEVHRHFSKDNIQMAKKHMKRCSTLLVIREMQVKTIMRYHLTPVRTAVIKKSTNNKCWRGHGGKGALLQCWWECELVRLLWKTWRFPKKIKINLPMIPQSSSWAILYVEKMKTLIQKDTFIPVCTAALFTIAKSWKRCKCPSTDEWIVVHTYNAISVTKKEIFK